ncbi:hypothetical protein FGRMN_7822, partial [Fusarium graminum]
MSRTSEGSSSHLLFQSYDNPKIGHSDESSFWPSHPKPLNQGRGSNVLKIVLFLPLIITWALFIVLAILICLLNGQPITPYGDAVREAIGVASTLWPIALAAVIGALLRAAALFQAERGTRLGTLAVLLGSQTFVNTLKTAFSLRIVSPWSILLAIIWTFSPLGGQAVLRAIQVTSNIQVQNHNITYNPAANVGLPFNSFIWESTYFKSYQGKVIPMFGAALSAPNALLQASNGSSSDFDKVVEQLGRVAVVSAEARTDLWGNVRVPEITSLPGYTRENPHGWVEVPSDRVVTYESLIGIPIKGAPPKTAGNMSLQLSATYLALECSDWFDTAEWLKKVPNGLYGHNVMNSSIFDENILNKEGPQISKTYMAIPSGGNKSDFNFSSHDRYSKGPIRYSTLVFGEEESSTICDLSQVHVDLKVKCERLGAHQTMSCEAQEVRHSPGYKTFEPDTQLTLQENQEAPGFFLASIPWLTIQGLVQGPAATGSYYIDYSLLPLQVFSQRLALLINTAMRVSCSTDAVLRSGEKGVERFDTLSFGTTTAAFSTSHERYQVQR